MPTQLDQVILSDSNRTPIIQIVVWFCLVTSFLAFITHAGIKLYVFRALRAESAFLLASLVSTSQGATMDFHTDCLHRSSVLLSLLPHYCNAILGLASQLRT